MATVAVIGTLRMTAGFSCGYIAIVTETALFIGFVMRKRCPHRSPGVGGMAGVAQVTGQWMIARLKCARADTVVATGAGTSLPRDCGVIKSCT